MDPLKELKNAHAAGVILGLKGVAGTVPRKDIDVLLDEDPDVFNLFLLALSAIQDPSMSKDKMGYFEIAGIHGMPKRPWDGVDGKDLSYDEDSGYCAHSTERFPTWHRPYIAMMEQSLYLMILEIVSRYDEPYRSAYQKAAQRFRIPYWDYFRPRGGDVKCPGIIDNGLTSYPFDYSCPKVFTTPILRVRMYPTNNLVPLNPNPLHHYKFETGSMGKDWEKMKIPENLFPRTHTVRYPRPNPKWGDSVTILNSVLNALRMDTNRLVLSMMDANVYGDYDVFSTNKLHKKPPPQPKEVIATNTGKAIWSWPSGSLEAIHGLYHGLIGGDGLSDSSQMDVGAGGGHMSRVATAAFDPIFWFHHCQIDRLFAIWQAIHDKEAKSWFSNPEQAKLPLLPSRKIPGNDVKKSFWTSNDAKSAEYFGYTYPDLFGTSEEVLSWRLL